MAGYVWIGALMGVGGTLAMDIWSILLEKLFAQPRPNWGLVGRWAAHVPHGRIFNDEIDQLAPVSQETLIGWIFHYAVGIAYGAIFILIAGAEWLGAPRFLPVLIFSLATILAGWFVLSPGLGLGMAVSKTPSPWTGRALGLVAHTMFALGMWNVALLLGA